MSKEMKINIVMRRPENGERGYIGANTSYPPRKGEDWSRGNDLADGEFSDETLERIFEDIRAVYRGDRT